jgi:hypothetical protein
MNITEKTAYLKGLCEGFGIDSSKPEGKMINEIIKVLDEIALDLTDLDDRCETLNEYIEEIDEDLGDVESYLFEEDDDCDCDCDCDEEYDDDDDFYEIVCPSCGETVCFDATVDPDSLVCPACNEKIECSGDCAGCSGCDSED